MDQRQNGTYHDGVSGENLYSQSFNAPDNLYPHLNDQSHNDASWGVNTSSYPQSQTVYHTQDWAAQHHPSQLTAQHLNTQAQSTHTDAYRRSPLSNNTSYGSAAFNGFGSQPGFYQQPQYDPSLMSDNSAFKQYQPAYRNQSVESRTIQPQALEHEPNYRATAGKQKPDGQNLASTANRAVNLVDQQALVAAVPAGRDAGIFSIIDFEQLVRRTDSERMSAFATIAREPQEWDINRAALPAYVQRKSRNALKRMAGQDGDVLAKLNHKSAKKPRSLKISRSRSMKTAHDVAGGVMLKSARTDKHSETSDSEDSSDYTSESDVEESPLPSRRPEHPKQAIEYDTVKALWRSKRRAVDANDVRKGLVDFWEIVKTVRDRWKLDQSTLTDAEKAKLKGELPVLRQRVTDSRDMMETAFKTAIKHGNRTIIESFKENDVNGGLARTMLEVMSMFSSITNAKLEKTYLSKVLPRYIKNGDARTQFYAKTIMNKAASEKAEMKGTVDAKIVNSEAVTGVKRPAAADNGPVTKNTAVEKPAPVSITATTTKKRLLGDDAAKPAAKKAAVSNSIAVKPSAVDAKSKTAGSNKLTTGLFAGLQSAAKKPGTSVKSSGSTAAATAKDVSKVPGSAAVTKTATSAPASKAAAPGRSVFSFAETMKSLAAPKEEKPAPKPSEQEVLNETPEQKARRLRRDARGPLRVHWKSNEELVAIREFTHDPDEETGHDSSQTRDVTDLKGEGRMFKQQHNKMAFDDDEDETMPQTANIPLTMVDWSEPTPVDFSDVPTEERERNYFPYGGGQTRADSAENAIREEYERNTLMVFYSHSDEIPPTPGEPQDPISGEPGSMSSFGAWDEKYVVRAKQNVARQQTQGGSIQVDFDAIRNALKVPAVAPPVPAAMAPAGQPALDIGSIIAQLNQNKPAQPSMQGLPANPFIPQPLFQAPSAPFPGFFPPPPHAAVPPPTGGPDISAILASLQNSSQPAPQAATPAVMPSAPVLDAGFANFIAQYQAQQQQAQMTGTAGAFEDPERKRWRDEQAAASGGDTEQNPFYKTKVCKYWQEGKCTKGDNCTYRHT